MFNALFILIKVALVAGAVVFVSQYDGHVVIDWNDIEISTSIGVVMAGAILLGFVWAFIYKIWHAIVTLPAGIRKYRVYQAREKGYQAVTLGLVAVAAGDAHGALKQSKRARDLIPDTALAKLLGAQAALMGGDTATARFEFEKLTEDKTGAFFGVRGLLNSALRSGNHTEALTLMRRAEAIAPGQGWVLENLFVLEAREKHWDNALTALKRAYKAKTVSDAKYDRHRRTLFLARAQEALNAGDKKNALASAKYAFHIDKSFAPSAILTAKMFAERGKMRAAFRVIEHAFEMKPHPDLCDLWIRLEPETKVKPPFTRAYYTLQWAKRLYQMSEKSPEANQMLGHAALEAREYGLARPCLEAAEDYRRLARLEREQTGSEAKARDWLERAADARPAPKWICAVCGHASLDWTALCHHCGEFDTQDWRVPTLDIHTPLAISGFDNGFIEPPKKTSGQF